MLAAADIKRLFSMLNDELREQAAEGELFLVGGAVMCLVYDARPATRDVDAFFRPAKVVREAAARVALRANLPVDWLNDAVKGYLGTRGEFQPFLELSHLRVMAARADYLLAMKCLSMRIGEEFHDLDDARYLLRHLGIAKYAHALRVISAYYPLERFPQKTLYALEGLLKGE